MKVSYVKAKDAVGMVLAHDITRITQGGEKGPAFKKGHIVREEDVDLLLSIGKEHIYSLELEEGDIHEDDAGLRIASLASGPGVKLEGPSEGRIDLVASIDGLLKVDVEVLQKLNIIPDVVFATLHTNTPVKKGDKLAGTRVIPLVVSEGTLARAEEACRLNRPVMEVRPYCYSRIGGIITGREVYEGRIKDAFAPVIKDKAKAFALEKPDICYVPDDAGEIAASIKAYVEGNKEIIIVTGGMSVDPDDVTPRGIRLSGARIEKYGVPVMPGAMFMVAYHGKIPIIGFPACGMFFRTTIFDLVFPRLLAGESLTAVDLASLGHGGFCRRCDSCRYPSCAFGKGGMPVGP